jgi:hypothetical protein
MHINFWSESVSEETTWKAQMYVGYNIKLNVTETGWEDGNWNILVQDRDQWRAVERSCPCALNEHHVMKAYSGVEV